MKDTINRIITFICIATILVSCHSEGKTNDKVAYMKAFADTYGVIRWFYPGDEAQTVDWNAVAVDFDLGRTFAHGTLFLAVPHICSDLAECAHLCKSAIYGDTH